MSPGQYLFGEAISFVFLLLQLHVDLFPQPGYREEEDWSDFEERLNKCTLKSCGFSKVDVKSIDQSLDDVDEGGSSMRKGEVADDSSSLEVREHLLFAGPDGPGSVIVG